MAIRCWDQPVLLQKTHRTGLPDLGFDAVLGFKLLDELLRAESGRQDVGLPLHGGEIAGAQQFQQQQILR